MSTANIMIGLLNASGLKERLSELGGKARQLQPDFLQAEPRQARAGQGEEEFLSRFGVSGEEADVPTPARGLPAENHADAPEMPVEDATEAAGNVVEITADTEADAVMEAEEAAAPEEEVKAEMHPLVEPSQRGASAFVPLAAASVMAKPAEPQPQQMVIEEEPGAGSRPVAVGRDEKSAVQVNYRAEHAAVSARGDRAAPIARMIMQKSDGPVQAAGLPEQAADRANEAGLFKEPAAAKGTRSAQPLTDGAVQQGRNGLVFTEARLLTVNGFKMSPQQSAYPGNFSEKFSKQLDMMRPEFRASPAADGLNRAVEAGGQVMSLQTANGVTGTVPKIQQTIQAALVNLARETSGSTPTAKTLELSLLPRSLGEIKVHMIHEGGRISVEITTHTASATQAMETAKTDIVKAYLQLGLQPDDVNIRVTESRDAPQTTQSASSEPDRNAQAGGQGLARNGSGSSPAERQQNASHREEGTAHHATGEEGSKAAETARPVRSEMMGKVQYF